MGLNLFWNQWANSGTTKLKTTKATNITLLIDGHSVTLEDVERVAKYNQPVALSDLAKEQITRSRAVIEKVLTENRVVYGVTTGFGKFKDVYIAPEDSIKLQRNFLLSHAAGVGPAFDRQIVRAITLLRANALAKGYSGIRQEVVQLLLDFLNHGIHPTVPEQGSVGASGDLAPLAHLSLVLIGEGEAEVDGKLLSGREALMAKKLAPVTLLAKEGLALTNGTQVMSAIGALVVLQAERLAKMADIVGAMSLEAQMGSEKAFSELVHNVRPHPGQIASARNLRAILRDSAVMLSHADCPLVQDAYSLRCMPQVHGASRQAFAHARSVLEIELNSATDNPLVFEKEVISGGNFHGQPLALVMDYVGTAIAELANISERRTERLVNPTLSNGLPAFLTENGGLNSGYMIAQYTAAALVSENKVLAHPASVDSIPTSANQEDHVSMGTIACRKARAILLNAQRVLAIELLCAAQALDLRTGAYVNGDTAPADLEPGIGVRAAHRAVRTRIKHLGEDRELHLDIARAEQIIVSGELIHAVEEATGSLE
jgi:histidine ammonia-lyase